MVSTPDIPLKSGTVKEFVVNADQPGGGVTDTAALSFEAVATQLSTRGPIADAIVRARVPSYADIAAANAAILAHSPGDEIDTLSPAPAHRWKLLVNATTGARYWSDVGVSPAADTAAVEGDIAALEAAVATKAEAAALAAETAARTSGDATLTSGLAAEVVTREGLITPADGVRERGPGGFIPQYFTEGEIRLGAGQIIRPSATRHKISGPQGYVAQVIRDDGRVINPPSETDAAAAEPSAFQGASYQIEGIVRSVPADVVMLIPVYGESYDGFQNSTYDVEGPKETAIHTTPVYPSELLMPAGGIRPLDAAFAAMADLREQTYVAGDPRYGTAESICSSFAKVLFPAYNARFGRNPKVAMLSVAEGGRARQYFGPGSANFAKLEAACARAATLLRQMGYRVIIPAILSSQRVNDASIAAGGATRLRDRATFDGLMLAAFEAMVRRVCPQQVDPVTWLALGIDRSKTGGLLIETGLALQASERANPGRIVCAGPGYAHKGDAHYDNEGYMTAGAAYAVAFASAVLGLGHVNLDIAGIEWLSDTTFRLTFDMAYGETLVFAGADEAVAAAGLETSKGFALWDGATPAVVPISSVAISDTGQPGGASQALIVTTSRAYDWRTLRLHYALDGGGAQTTAQKARGLVRTSYAGPTVTDQAGTPLAYPHRRWLIPSVWRAGQRMI